MVDMTIQPKVGLGPVRFGMTRAQVRSAIAQPVEEYLKTPDSTVPTDAFDAVGVHVFYSAAGRCEAIEAGSPARPTLLGRDLLGQRYSAVLKWLGREDPKLEQDESGATSLKLGLSLYVPNAKDRDARVDGVLLFEEGYFD